MLPNPDITQTASGLWSTPTSAFSSAFSSSLKLGASQMTGKARLMRLGLDYVVAGAAVAFIAAVLLGVMG